MERVVAVSSSNNNHNHNIPQQSALTHEAIWKEFRDAAVESLIPWDQEYLQRMPKLIGRLNDDDSIFMSIVSFRDENCFHTLYEAFSKAQNPSKLFVGLNQQNCNHDCISGVQARTNPQQQQQQHGGGGGRNGRTILVDPDPDCQQLFCASDVGKLYCDHVRVLRVDENDSLGPIAARYFASKLYHGETWYVQMDAHMVFLEGWDRVAIAMMRAAPSRKPVITHYPPGHKMNLTAQKPTGRLCGALFHYDTIRFEELGKYDHEALDIPHFAPFVGAGFLMASADVLRQVPFDPMLPYIFMGEEVIMSTRLWTSGYDIFSPSQAVVGHMYVRAHTPKFWESVSRFTHVYDQLEELVLQRIKFQLGYPESARDMQIVPSVLDHVELYGMGKERNLSDYMKSVGIDVWQKEIIDTKWCKSGTPPDNMKHLSHLYRNRTSAPQRKV